MPAERIDGTAVALAIRSEAAAKAKELTAKGVRPGLAVVLVGDDPASAVYVRAKGKACEEAGMHSVTIRMSADTTQDALLGQVKALNEDAAIHGILVQMPLPKHIDSDLIIRTIRPEKDVDGFHPVNVGKNLIGEKDGFVPCTPAGVQELLVRSGVQTKGAECVIVGRSNIVGKPMMALMIQQTAGANSTVTVCHSATKDLAAHTKRADILIVAAGRPNMVTGAMVKPGAVVIDVGVNRLPGGSLAGDVDYASVSRHVRRSGPWITATRSGYTAAALARNDTGVSAA